MNKPEIGSCRRCHEVKEIKPIGNGIFKLCADCAAIMERKPKTEETQCQP